MFFAIGFETTAPSTALTLLRARELGVRTSPSSATTSRSSRRSARSSIRPTCGWTRFIGPGHVSTVIGCRPYEFIARDYGRPIVVSGFEPLDILQSIVMMLRQLRDGRGEGREPVPPRRAVGRQSARRCRALAEVFEVRPYFEWRGLGFISQSALRLRDAYAAVGRRAALRRARRARRRSEGGAVRRSAQGRAEAAAVQAVRQGMHAGASGRRADGLVGRRLRGVLQLRQHRRRRWSMSTPERPMADRQPRRPSAVPRPADRDGARRRRQGEPPAGRRADRAAARRIRRAKPLADAAHVRPSAARAWRSPPTASSCSRCAFPAARSANWRSTAR